MTTQRLDILVRQARDSTGNQNYSSTQGIPQREFVKWANHAQERIFNLLLQKRSSLYTKESFADCTANTASYALPTDVHLQHNVIGIEFSPTGNARDYYPLDLRSPRQQYTTPGLPDSYFLRSGNYVVSPVPVSNITNAFRINYQYTLPAIDVRRGGVASWGGPTGGYFTSITVQFYDEESYNDVYDVTSGFRYVDYLALVDGDGVQKTQTTGMPISSVLNVGTLTLQIGFTTNSVPSATNSFSGTRYAVFGQNVTTHSQLPKIAERYIFEYMKLMAQMRDSNAESADSNTVLQALEKEILDGVENLEEDLVSLAILDASMMNYADDWE